MNSATKNCSIDCNIQCASNKYDHSPAWLSSSYIKNSHVLVSFITWCWSFGKPLNGITFALFPIGYKHCILVYKVFVLYQKRIYFQIKVSERLVGCCFVGVLFVYLFSWVGSSLKERDRKKNKLFDLKVCKPHLTSWNGVNYRSY